MGPVNGHLIDAGDLAASIGDIATFDVRWKLNAPEHGANAYAAGHIPGALFVDLDRDLSGPPDGGRHPLPAPADFAATLGRLGVSPGDRVVVYDDVAGRVAARMWWMLRAIGHEEVRVLDGGIQAWVAAGQPLSNGHEEPAAPTIYPVPTGFKGAVGMDELAGRDLVDMRERDRYVGETEPIDPRAGHIPGARNVPASLTIRDGRLKAPRELDAVMGGGNPVLSCGSGVVACHGALAMAVAGHPVPEVYIGSFSEWSRTDRPVATGDEP